MDTVFVVCKTYFLLVLKRYYSDLTHGVKDTRLLYNRLNLLYCLNQAIRDAKCRERII